jgi:hypothetical protein
MQKHNDYHDIEITTPSTVVLFELHYIFLFSLWFMIFIFTPLFLIFIKEPEAINNQGIEETFSIIIIKLFVNLLVFIFYLLANYLFLASLIVRFEDRLTLLRSSKIIRLEKHQITFIPTRESFQKDPVKLPDNLLELLVIEDNLRKLPGSLVDFIFISKDAPPLTFFSSKDAILANKIDQEIADFYQVKLTEKLFDRSTWD